MREKLEWKIQSGGKWVGRLLKGLMENAEEGERLDRCYGASDAGMWEVCGDAESPGGEGGL